jgi:hypothetical protein
MKTYKKATPDEYSAWKARVKRLKKDGLIFKIEIVNGRLSFWVQEFPKGWTNGAKEQFNIEYGNCVENLKEQFTPKENGEIRIDDTGDDLFAALKAETAKTGDDFAEMAELNSDVEITYKPKDTGWWPEAESLGMKHWHCERYSRHRQWWSVKGIPSLVRCMECSPPALITEDIIFGEGEEHPKAYGTWDRRN